MAQKITVPKASAAGAKPTRTWRRVALIAGSLAALLVLVSTIAPFFIPWDKIRAEAISAGSKALGRELGINKIEVSLFTGVHIKNLSLANAKGGFSDQALFTNDDAKVDVNLLSIFTGKLVINSITFDKPQLLIETNSRGISNLVGIGGAPEQPGSAQAAAPATVASATVGGKTFPAVLLSLVIKDGDVILRDKQKGTETAIHGLNIKLQGLSLEAAGASRLEADMIAEVEGKKIPLSLASDFRLDLPKQRVDIESMDLKAPAVDANLAGSVQNFGQPVIDLHAGVDVDLQKLPDLLPPSVLAKLPPDLKTSGSIKLDLSTQGAIAQPKALALKGSLSFADVNAVYGSYPALGGLKGVLSFDKSGVDLPDLSLKLGGDPVDFAFNARWGDLGNILGPSARMQAVVRYQLRSPKLNLDPLLGAAHGGAGPAASGGAKASQGAGAGALPNYASEIPRGLSLQGDIAVDSIVAQGFTTGKFIQRLVLKNQKISSSTDLTLYQGRAYERSTVDLSRSGPPFTSTFGLYRIAFRGLVDDAAAASAGSKLAQLKGKVDGTFTLKANVQGKGFSQPYALDNTRAAVDFQFENGHIQKTDMQQKLAEVVPYPQIQKILGADIDFSAAAGELAYADRRVTLKSFNLGSGRDWRQGQEFIQANGAMVLGGALDFKIVPHFNPSLGTLGGDVGRAFEDDKGWTTFDYIEYSGPDAQDAKADFTACLKKAAQKALSQHVDQIKAMARQAVEQKAGGLLKQLPGGLNKLFGQ